MGHGKVKVLIMRWVYFCINVTIHGQTKSVICLDEMIEYLLGTLINCG